VQKKMKRAIIFDAIDYKTKNCGKKNEKRCILVFFFFFFFFRYMYVIPFCSRETIDGGVFDQNERSKRENSWRVWVGCRLPFHLLDMRKRNG
jgi:hypothetical protein